MAVWNEASEDELISMIQERPALYDIMEKCYVNRVAKAELWREIENKLVISGTVRFPFWQLRSLESLFVIFQ